MSPFLKLENDSCWKNAKINKKDPAQPNVVLKIITAEFFSEGLFLMHQIFHFLDHIYKIFGACTPSGSWLAPHACNSDLRVSADPVDVRNGPQSGPRPRDSKRMRCADISVVKFDCK